MIAESRDPDPTGPPCESQTEYIRRLEGRLQEMSRFVACRRELGGLADVASISAHLRAYAVEALGFAHARVVLAGEPDLGNGSILARALTDGTLLKRPPSADAAAVPGLPGKGEQAAIPLLCGDEKLGAIAVEGTPPLDPWPLSLLEAAATDAARDLLRIRIAGEHDATISRITGITRIHESIVESNRLDELLSRTMRVAVETLGASWGAAWVIDRASGDLRLAATFGTAPAAAGPADAEDRVAQLAEHAKKAIQGHGLLRRPAGGSAASSFPAMSVPVVAFGDVLGAIGVAGRTGRNARGPGIEDEPFLRLVAAHAALAIQNASVSGRYRDAERRVKDLERQLVNSTRLAALGEMSAKLAHEIRNPLSAIGGFARRIEKALPEEDPNRSYAALIGRETARLEAILAEQLDFARSRMPRLSVVDLNAAVRQAIELVRPEIEAAGIQLLDGYESRIPGMLLDADRVKQVLLNILTNARQSTRSGNRIRVRTRASDGWAQVEISNDGEQIPGELIDQLFVPFATSKSTGSGLGLAVADQIVKDHGGEIRVRSDPEWSVIFTVSIPIRTNQDRRRTVDRRSRDRRRAA